MEKVRYEVDPHNRLAVRKTGRKTELSKFRKVSDGQFKTDNKNQLTYHIKAPFDDGGGPHQIKFKGKWSLTKNHDLRLTLDKWKRQTFGDQLTLQGDIVDVDKNLLLFAVGTRTNKGTQSIYLLKLEGSWQADERNRITFRINKGKDEYDTLIFDGIWQIGKNYQLIYQYQKSSLIREQKRIHTLAFKGSWQIRDKARINYEIDRNSGSEFNFKTSLGIFKDKYIKYELDIGVSRKKEPIKRTITFFGIWKIKKNLGLIFELEYGKRRIQTIVLGAEAKLTEKDTVLFKLKDMGKRGIGAEFKLNHKILKGEGEAFLRFLKSNRESAVFVGAGRGW